jgi:hypothetical protein
MQHAQAPRFAKNGDSFVDTHYTKRRIRNQRQERTLWALGVWGFLAAVIDDTSPHPMAIWMPVYFFMWITLAERPVDNPDSRPPCG